MEVRSWFLNVWKWIDPIYYAFTRLERIQSDSEKNVFRVRLMRYRGKEVHFPDGSSLKKGDLVLKIHLHNVFILQEMFNMKNELARAKWLYKMVLDSLPGLCQYVRQHVKSDQIKGIVGITLLNRGSETLGFQRVPLTHPLFRLYKWMTLLPIHLLSADKPLRSLKKHHPVYLCMSKKLLEDRYGS